MLVTVALAALIGARVDQAAVAALVAEVHPAWIALAALATPLTVALGGWRWSAVARSLEHPLPVRRAVGEYALSTLLNQLLPGGIAGDAVRVWRDGRRGSFDGALRVAVLDRWVGLWVHVVVTALGVGVALAAGLSLGVEAGVTVALLLGLSALPLTRTRLGAMARRALGARGSVLIGSSVASTAGLLAAFAACGAAVGQAPGLWVVAGVPLVLLSMAVPLSIGGWGLREATAIALLPQFGWSEEAALVASTAYGLAALGGSLPGLLPVALPQVFE